MISLLRKKKKQAISSRLPLKKSKSVSKRDGNKQSERLNPIDLELIAKKVEHESALIRIGKNGISDNIIDELKNLLSLKKAVKIKILQNAPIDEPKEFFVELERKIGFKIWRIKGNTGIFIFKKVD